MYKGSDQDVIDQVFAILTEVADSDGELEIEGVTYVENEIEGGNPYYDGRDGVLKEQLVLIYLPEGRPVCLQNIIFDENDGGRVDVETNHDHEDADMRLLRQWLVMHKLSVEA